MNDAEYIAAIAEFYKDGPSPEFRAHYERLMHISAAQAQDDAVAQAVAVEREACAQLAAQTVCDLHIPTGVKIYGARAAKAIRARGTDAAKPAAQAGEYPAGTGNPEADRIIGRLASSDPDFDDCADAVALIHKLVAEIKGPDGFDAWTVYSRSMDLVRVFWQQHTQADALSMTMAELHADVERAIRAALAAPAQAEPEDLSVAYFMGLHAAKRAPQPVEREPLTCAEVQKIVIEVCDAIYPQDDVSYSEADTVFYGAFVRAIEEAIWKQNS